MMQSIGNRFVSVAQIFLLSCVTVLLAAAGYALLSFDTVARTQSHAHILFTLLR